MNEELNELVNALANRATLCMKTPNYIQGMLSECYCVHKKQ